MGVGKRVSVCVWCPQKSEQGIGSSRAGVMVVNIE